MEILGFEDRIKDYLEKKAAEDLLFAETYRSSDKTVTDCCEWITKEVRKAAEGKRELVLSDNTVFSMAVHFYDEKIDYKSNFEKEVRNDAIKEFAKNYQMTEADIDEARNIAMQEAIRNEKAKLAKKPVKNEEPKEQQLSLFEL